MLEHGVPRKWLRGQLLFFLFWLVVTVIGICLTPNPTGHGTHRQLGLPPCPSVVFFNRPCPGCGLTTSFTATIHGQFDHAFRAHPLGSLVYLVFTGFALLSIVGWVKGFRLRTETKRFNYILGVCALVFFAFGAIRWLATPDYGNSEDIRALIRAKSK